MALRYADVPVVVAPAGLTLGGGCEIVAARRPRAGGGRDLHGPRRGRRRPDPGRRRHQGDAGARPTDARAGGRRSAAVRPAGVRDDRLRARSRRARRHARAARATCATSTAITMNRERLIADAKALALRASRDGYRPPPRRTAIPVGGDRRLAALKLGVHLAWRAGRISDHDALIGRTLAHDPGRRRAAAPDDGHRGRTCSTSSARRSCSCAASARRSSGSSTR